jgi:glucose-1-phosphate cytidylyltransferase
MKVHEKKAEPWAITLVDTGDNSMTRGRLGRVADLTKARELIGRGSKVSK